MTTASLPSRVSRRFKWELGKLRLERDFARVMRTRPMPGAVGGPRIGIATFGSGEWHFTLEVLLAHALGIRGARPELLVCDWPELPICEERNVYSRHNERCDGCCAAKRGLLENCGLPWRGLQSLASADVLQRAREIAWSLDAAEIEAYVERGWPIGKWLHVSACHYLRCDARGQSAERIETRRRLLAAAIVTVEAVEGWLDQVQPDIVIVQSGAHLAWRITREMAAGRGIPVFCREIGKGGFDVHIYALDADCMSPDLSSEWTIMKDAPLTIEEEAAVDRFLSQLPERTYPQTRPITRRTPEQLRAALGIAANQRVAVAFTNVPWDLATADRDRAFDGLFDWLNTTLEALEGTAAHLIVRCHPAEAAVSTRERVDHWLEARWHGRTPEGVTVLPPEDGVAAADVCAIASAVLTYNSHVAIEAAAAGHAVVVAGAPHFAGHGFTIDVESRASYIRWLRSWSEGQAPAPPPNASALARRYSHLFFLRYHVPMRWTTSPFDPPFALRIQSLAELAPGHNPAVDAVCDGILNRRQVVLSRAAAGELW